MISMLNTLANCALSTQYLLHTAFFPPQAHMQARFVILRVLLEAGEGLVTVTPTTGSDGRPDARVHLDRSKIRSVGRPALERFLRRLQVSEGLSSWLPLASFLSLSPTCQYLLTSWMVPSSSKSL